jgi:hypothetical protein
LLSACDSSEPQVSTAGSVRSTASAKARSPVAGSPAGTTSADERLLSEEQGRDVRASYERAFGSDGGDDTTAESLGQAARQALREVEW